MTRLGLAGQRNARPGAAQRGEAGRWVSRGDLRRRARIVAAFAWFALSAYLFHLAWQLR
jgi:hypothetical protein